jgi:hypothetical protein
MPQASQTFPNCGPSELFYRFMNFSGGFVSGDYLIGTPTCTISVISFTNTQDPTPQSRLLAFPVINSPAIVQLYLGNMIAGNTYMILVTCSTYQGQNLELWTTQLCLSY